MNNLDFFTVYEGQKRRAQEIFKFLDRKIDSNKNELNEALFGLIKTAKDREKILRDYFFKITKSPDWQSFSVDLDSSGRQIKLENAAPEDLEDAWDFIREQAVGDEFKGTLIPSGGSIIYQEEGQSSNSQDSDTDTDSQQSQTNSPSYQITYDKKSNKYFFGSLDRYASKINNAPSEIQTYNFAKSPLKFLFEDPLKFGLREITFNFKEGSIASARDGFWIGDFVGRFFSAAFVGNNFRGAFSNNNEEWKSKPTAFISGTFKDTSKTGILGLQDVKQGNENYAFHLIQLPPSYSVEILTDKQLRHTITCEKRMDASNSNFAYSVYMGYDIDQVSPKSIVLPWETIRSNYDAYRIGGKMNSLPDLFSLASDEKIIELRVIESGTPPSFKKKERFDNTKEYIENTSNLRGLKQISGSKYNRNLKFNITNDSDFENFNKIKGYINSSQFLNDLNQASIYLDNKLISAQNIKSNFPYLINVFTSDVLNEAAVNLASPKKSLYGRNTPGRLKGNPNARVSGENSFTENGGISKEENAVLKRIENFVKYFVYKIDDGSNTNKIRKYFIDLLKAKITSHKEPILKTTTATTASPAPKPTVATKSVNSTPKKGGIGKLKESLVRNEIRNILKGLL